VLPEANDEPYPGTLYLCFAAFPIVFQEYRGWSEGVGGLSFLGVAVGMMVGVSYAIWDNQVRPTGLPPVDEEDRAIS
jgi:hypothetical protein